MMTTSVLAINSNNDIKKYIDSNTNIRTATSSNIDSSSDKNTDNKHRNNYDNKHVWSLGALAVLNLSPPKEHQSPKTYKPYNPNLKPPTLNPKPLNPKPLNPKP